MIDLHIHTTATPHHSSWEPANLAATAAAQGFTVIAAADHNTTASVSALQAAGAQYGVRVISGVEIDSTFNGKLWHTLVYGVDPTTPELTRLCAAVFERNAADAARLIAELPAAGFDLAGLVGMDRPPNVADVATALARHNNVPGRLAGESDEEAGMRFLLTAMPGAYAPLDVTAIIKLAQQFGGLAILAHPGRSKGIYAIPATADDIAALAAAGLAGIEVFYPSHTLAQQSFLLEQAQRHHLLVSGGSDSHHPHQPLAHIAPAQVAALLERLAP